MVPKPTGWHYRRKEDEEWKVEEVKSKTTLNKETYYLVKWEGWPAEYNQWVLEKDMAGAPKAIRQYKKTAQEKAKKRRSTVSTEENP